MRVLALDFGSARCGAAISDSTATIATPIAAVRRPASRSGLSALVELASAHEVELVLVGLPLSLRGDDTEQTRVTREFAERLAARLPGIPVELHDERFTTALARRSALSSEPGIPKDPRQRSPRADPRAARRAGARRGARAAGEEDSRAAAHLLESWLAARSGPPADR